MTRILKIYEGNGDSFYKGTGSLLYDISGDLLDIRYLDLANYQIDLFSATIARGNYDIDINDVWRLYDIGGTLIGSGPIEKKPHTNSNGDLKIDGVGWTGILTRRLAEDESFSNKPGNEIFEDLIDTYFSDYNLNKTEIAVPSNLITNTYNNRTVYDVMREVSFQSYGANDRQFDFYIYESTPGTLKAKFFERSSATAVEILPGDIRPSGFNLMTRGDTNYNYIIVKGGYGNMVCTPSDANNDWWTEAAYGNIWGENGFNTGLDSTTYKIGSKSLEAESIGDNPDVMFSINLDHDNAYHATYTTQNFTQGLGYLNNHSRRQFIHFYILANRTMDVELGWDAGSGTLKETNFVVRGDSGSGSELDWTEQNINLYHLHGEGWVNIAEVRWGFPKILSGDEIHLDGLYFYDVIRFRGVHDGSVNPRKDYYFIDDGLKSNAACENIADYLYKELIATQYEGSVTLSSENTSLRAGDTVDVKYPLLGIDASNLPIQEIVWTKDNQILRLGRHRSLAEIIADTKTKIQRQYK